MMKNANDSNNGEVYENRWLSEPFVSSISFEVTGVFRTKPKYNDIIARNAVIEILYFSLSDEMLKEAGGLTASVVNFTSSFLIFLINKYYANRTADQVRATRTKAKNTAAEPISFARPLNS